MKEVELNIDELTARRVQPKQVLAVEIVCAAAKPPAALPVSARRPQVTVVGLVISSQIKVAWLWLSKPMLGSPVLLTLPKTLAETVMVLPQ